MCRTSMLFPPVDKEDSSSPQQFIASDVTAAHNYAVSVWGREGVLQALASHRVLQRLPESSKLAWLNLLVQACEAAVRAVSLVLPACASC